MLVFSLESESEICGFLPDNIRLKKLFGGWTLFWVHLEKAGDHVVKVFAILLADWLINAFKHFLIEPVHVIRTEGRFQGADLVQDTAHGPNIRFVIVRLVLPHLRRGIIRRACLSVEQTLFGHF
jgi:hypothetical protein